MQRVINLETELKEIISEELDNAKHFFETFLNVKIQKLPEIKVSEEDSSISLDVVNGILKIGIKDYKKLKKHENSIERLEHKLFGNDDATRLHFEVKRKLAEGLFCYAYYEKYKEHFTSVQASQSLLYEKLATNAGRLFSMLYSGNSQDYKKVKEELHHANMRNADFSNTIKQYIKNNTFWNFYNDKLAEWAPYEEQLANELSLIVLGELMERKNNVREVVKTVYDLAPEAVLQSLV